MLIGLRHDVDSRHGMEKGIPVVVRTENRVDARSTFYVRAALLRRTSREIVNYLLKLQDDGWEIALHLDNTTGSQDLPAPKEELDVLRGAGFEVYGVSPHGGVIGFRGDETWRVMDSLGLKYMAGYGVPKIPVRTRVAPPHIALEHYVRRGWSLNDFLRDLLSLAVRNEGKAIIQSHAEYFHFSMGVLAPDKPRAAGAVVRLLKTINKLTVALLTPLRLLTLNGPYSEVLNRLRDMGVPLVPVKSLV